MTLAAPPPRLTVSEWADAKRVLSSEASAEPGRWRTDRAPFQRGMMDAMSEEGIHTVVAMTCAQIGKSEFLLNAIGYFVDQDPAPMIQLQPTLEMAEAFSKDRLAPMFRDTPALKEKFVSSKSRSAKDHGGTGNTLRHKKFPGGHITLCGANSPASLAMRPVRVGLADEIDRYPVSAGAEGDPIALMKKRTATFHNRKILMTSTPTVKGASRIEMAFEESDQRRYYVPCPECGTMQPLEWSNLKWSKGDDDKWDQSDPWYECDHCQAELRESDKPRMLKGGDWYAESTAPGVAGFHINELYSPWRHWREMVEDFLEAKQDSELLRAFVNTSLGETFEDSGDGVEPDGLFARREPYAAEVPAGACVLVAGVDVQDNRLEVSVMGVGPGEETWLIDHQVIYGDPAGETVWEYLDDTLSARRFKHEGGTTFGISATCIDSGGHHTQRVYEYCRARKNRRIFAIKGMGGFGRAMVSAPSRKRHGRNSRPVDLYTLGVDELKSLVYSRLTNNTPGPGYIHFPIDDAFTEDYFSQLTSERIKRKFRKGVAYREWVLPSGRRNEALDCFGYAWAALLLLNPNLDAIAKKLGRAAESGEPDTEQSGPARNSRRARKPRGFANSWKG